MFKNAMIGYNVPEPGSVEAMEIRPASRGGGYLVFLTVAGKTDTMVFTNANVLTQVLMAMLNGAAFAQMANAAPRDVSSRPAAAPAPALSSVPALASEPEGKPKRKGGRPRLSEEERAARKAARAAAKTNSAHLPQQAEAAA